ncbi:MAG: hypothetical protein KTR28_08605 [Micavibrio sp.]|nr:hypothetical protein [Micavibrio sp.]
MQGIRKSFNLYSPAAAQPVTQPLNVMIVTSIRDVGADDKVGRKVSVEGRMQYMRGICETLLDQTNTNAPLSNTISIVGIVVDDVYGKDNLADYSLTPDETNSWIMNNDYSYRGENISTLVSSIPSAFRKIPKHETELRRIAKRNFEDAVINKAKTLSADVILSDHLIVKMETIHHNIPTINIHPAITNPLNEFVCKGNTPTSNTLQKAKEKGYARTGATLHFVDDGIDTGLIIAENDFVVVSPEWTPEKLRLECYKQSKIPVVIEGLKHLASNYNSLVNAENSALRGNRPTLNKIELNLTEIGAPEIVI